jgi:hypothetical protein
MSLLSLHKSELYVLIVKRLALSNAPQVTLIVDNCWGLTTIRFEYTGETLKPFVSFFASSHKSVG